MSQFLYLLNVKAVIVAAIVYFIIGAVWYSSVLFGKAWMRENGIDPSRPADKKRMIRSSIYSFLLYLAAAVVFSMFLGRAPGLLFGAFAGLMIGLGWISTIMGTHYIFERRSWKLFLIHAGYAVLGFIAMGMILGGWR